MIRRLAWGDVASVCGANNMSVLIHYGFCLFKRLYLIDREHILPAGHGGTLLESRHLGGGGGRIRSWRPTGYRVSCRQTWTLSGQASGKTNNKHSNFNFTHNSSFTNQSLSHIHPPTILFCFVLFFPCNYHHRMEMFHHLVKLLAFSLPDLRVSIHCSLCFSRNGMWIEPAFPIAHCYSPYL